MDSTNSKGEIINYLVMVILCASDQKVEVPYNTLQGVFLNNLNLHRALLEGENLSNSTFRQTDLRGAFLSKCNLSNCVFIESNLITAFLISANLQNAKLNNCKAMYSNFSNANLKNADLNDSLIYGADFSLTFLQGCKLLCEGINEALFNGAVYDETTLWPLSFNPEYDGCIKL